MVCSIETVESRWTPRAIAGVRMLNGQSFTVTREPSIKVTPRYVIDSRITSLAEESAPPLDLRQTRASTTASVTSHHWVLWHHQQHPLNPVETPRSASKGN